MIQKFKTFDWQKGPQTNLVYNYQLWQKKFCHAKKAKGSYLARWIICTCCFHWSKQKNINKFHIVQPNTIVHIVQPNVVQPNSSVLAWKKKAKGQMEKYWEKKGNYSRDFYLLTPITIPSISIFLSNEILILFKVITQKLNFPTFLATRCSHWTEFWLNVCKQENCVLCPGNLLKERVCVLFCACLSPAA